MKDLLKSAKSGKKRAGQRELIKWLEGGKLTRSQAVKAHCYDCSGKGEFRECNQKECPLLPFSPFNRQKHRFLGGREEKTPISESSANKEREA